jgi:hypothetical protein
MENQIQQQVATVRAMQLTAGVPSTQLARNIMPMRQLVRLAIMAAKARAIVDGKEFNGLTLQQIIVWLNANNFGANYGTVAGALTKLKRKGVIAGGYQDSPVYLWNEKQ